MTQLSVGFAMSGSFAPSTGCSCRSKNSWGWEWRSPPSCPSTPPPWIPVLEKRGGFPPPPHRADRPGSHDDADGCGTDRAPRACSTSWWSPPVPAPRSARLANGLK